MGLGRGKRSSTKLFSCSEGGCRAAAVLLMRGLAPLRAHLVYGGRSRARIFPSSCAGVEHLALGQECQPHLQVPGITEVGSSARGGLELVHLCSISCPSSFQFFLSLSHSQPPFLPECLLHSLWAPAPETKVLYVWFNQLPQFGWVKSLF